MSCYIALVPSVVLVSMITQTTSVLHIPGDQWDYYDDGTERDWRSEGAVIFQTVVMGCKWSHEH